MKKVLRNTVASTVLALAVAPVVSTPTFAQDNARNTNPPVILFAHSGDIDPFRGDIDPFTGDINPFRGDIDPFYGDISPFWGDISPFWGDIDPFGGDINPFGGDINPFWGDIDPFGGDIDPFGGDIDPFWGDISPFWGDIGPFWGDINALWGDIDPFTETATSEYQGVVNSLQEIFDRADDVFGEAVEYQTGRSLRDAVLADLLAKYGLDLNDPNSLANLDGADRSAFFLDFYDGLMGYTGVDRVDHWMASANWSPALARSVGGGENIVVGVLDFSFTASEALNILRLRGDRTDYGFAHGAAVASLINAPIDGQGVMGVAPSASISTYNPFDETLSTNFDEVRTGMLRMFNDHIRVLNMSLGVPGTTFAQEWSDVFAHSRIEPLRDQAVFVFAAGNDGFTQDTDINWNRVRDVSTLLVVGSVDPANNISVFSNRPGDACFTVRTHCQDGFRLMDRFLVAPGELMLVSDGHGGVTRQTGTSFAAPLVSGAAALVQGRWGWLQSRDVADVLLRSARDLGAPGTDSVYGRGMLDIGAALSPLDRDNLYIVFDANDAPERRDVQGPGWSAGRLVFHSADENSVVMFEDLNDTFRDFVVPLDELNFELTEDELARAMDAQAYLAERSQTTTTTTTTTSSDDDDDDDDDGGRRRRDRDRDFRDTHEYSVAMSGRGNLRVSAIASARDPHDRASNHELGFQIGVRVADDHAGREFRFGYGEGALALSTQEGFGLFSDHRPETGGVNPVLGFASGGLYGMAGYEVSERTRLTFGLTSNFEELNTVMPHSGEELSLSPGMDPYEAAALSVSASHTVNDRVEVNLGYTMLHEETGFLGAQGAGPLDLSGGTMTDAVTLGIASELPMHIRLNASATVSRTRGSDLNSGSLQLSENTLATAFQVSMSRGAVLFDTDAVRVSFIQPLHVESGALEYSTARVTDRETGTMELTSETWRLGGERPLYAEAMYGMTLFDGSTDFNVYSRIELAGDDQYTEFSGVTAGGRITIEF